MYAQFKLFEIFPSIKLILLNIIFIPFFGVYGVDSPVPVTVLRLSVIQSTLIKLPTERITFVI